MPELQIKENHKYRMNIPNGKNVLLYIDYILDSKQYINEKIVICREYWRPKKRWMYYNYSYTTLAIYNGWDYEGKEL